MPFCTSCGIQNPDGAKFCAKCGAKLADAPSVKPDVSPQPAETPPMPKEEVPQPSFGAESPLQGGMEKPKPGVPGQTNFYMAAAGVSSGAKLKRFFLFVIVIVVVGVALFLLIRFSVKKQQETRAALQKKPEQSMPLTPATDFPDVAGEPGAAEDSNPQATTTDPENGSKEIRPAKRSAKSKKRTKRKRR